MRSILPLLLLLPAFLSAQVLESGPRTDYVWLTTGDRVSGEIVELDGKLTVKTSFAGDIKIDWEMVERIESSRTFAVELGSGLQIQGTVQREEDEVRIVTGTAEQIISPDELRRIERTGESRTFWDVADLTIGLGASVTGGNSRLRQNSLDAGFRHRNAKRKIAADARSLVSTEDGRGRIARNEVGGRVDRFINKDIFAYAHGAFESDERSLLDLRLTGGGGLGWQIMQRSDRDLSLRGGFNLVREHYGADETNSARRDTSSEMMFGVEARRVTRRDITLFLKAYTYPSIEQSRYRLAGDAGVRFPVFKFLIWSLSGFSRYDSAPPTDKIRHDYGLVTSFGFAF